MAMTCSQCGHVSNFMHPRAVYSCRVPNCQAGGLLICANCEINIGAGKDAFGTPQTCPFCGSALNYHGNL